MKDMDGSGECFSPTGSNGKVEILPQRAWNRALSQQRE
jgi:hypothetical protein